MTNSKKTSTKRNTKSVKGKEPSIQKSTEKYTSPKHLEERTREELLFLVQEQRRRMDFLSAQLEFFKHRVIELEAEPLLEEDEDSWTPY